MEREVNWPRISMGRAVRFLQHYIGSYKDDLGGWKHLETRVFIDDVLYGLGVAIAPKRYRFADGFKRFKADLVKYLQSI